MKRTSAQQQSREIQNPVDGAAPGLMNGWCPSQGCEGEFWGGDALSYQLQRPMGFRQPLYIGFCPECGLGVSIVEGSEGYDESYRTVDGGGPYWPIPLGATPSEWEGSRMKWAWLNGVTSPVFLTKKLAEAISSARHDGVSWSPYTPYEDIVSFATGQH